MLRLAILCLLIVHLVPAQEVPVSRGQCTREEWTAFILDVLHDQRRSQAKDLLGEPLRHAGPVGLAALGDAFDRLRPDQVQLPLWDKLFDAVAAQHLARHSRLYWYTDLDQARAAAKASGKPIVSLRLLGKLTDQLSCANSRFFRVVLYADPLVAAWLREHVVLHWWSERPVPLLTIDFGDGRQIKTTITGNSAHYVLDEDGRPIDCIPGLYEPHAFLAALQRSEALHRLLRNNPGRPSSDVEQRETTASPAEERKLVYTETLARWHAKRAEELLTERRALGLPDPAELPMRPRVSAAEAEALTRSKRAIELPTIRAMIPAHEAEQVTVSKAEMEAPSARALVSDHAHQPPVISWSDVAGRRPTPMLSHTSVMLIEDDLASHAQDDPSSVLSAFLSTLATDTVRNELDLHLQIHRFFVGPQLAKQSWHVEFGKLNSWLYAELFLTPASDPWLGLDPSGAYAALPGNGLISR
jgi:hypothetical protein